MMKSITPFLLPVLCFCTVLLLADQTKDIKKMLKGRSQLDLDEQAKETEKRLKKQTLFKEEGKSLGMEANDQMKNFLHNLYQKEGALTAFQNDLLSEKDQGKTFDVENATTQMKSGIVPKTSEVESFVAEVWGKVDAREEESYLKEAAAVIEKPQREIGIISSEMTVIPEEMHLRTCLEKGTYLKTIFQTLRVHVDRKVTGKRKTCKGHTGWKIATWPFKWSAKSKEKWLKGKLKNHANVAPSFKTKIVEDENAGWGVSYYWEHLNPDQGDFTLTEKPWKQKCFSYEEHNIIQEKERDEWVIQTQDLAEFKRLTQECALVQADEYKQGENAATNGKNVWRNAWEKRLVFSCAPEENSPCEQLKDLGGVFVSKNCIEEDSEGNCRLVEKTYEMGGSKAAYTQETFHFNSSNGQEERIFGFEEFDCSYEKNTSFGAVFAIYSAVADLESQMVDGHLDPNQPLLFAGEPSSCRKCFSSGKVFDCCYRKSIKGRGLIIGSGFGQCNEEERDLFEKVDEKRCHRVGRYRKGIIERHVYCCFPTILSRIVQVQGKRQLGIGWGIPEKPDCSGITLNDLRRLDFEKMDFSDFTESIQDELSSQEVARKVKQLTKDFSDKNCYSKAKLQTENIVEKQQEKIRLEGRQDVP